MSDNFAVNAFNNYGVWDGVSQESSLNQKDPLGVHVKSENPTLGEFMDGRGEMAQFEAYNALNLSRSLYASIVERRKKAGEVGIMGGDVVGENQAFAEIKRNNDIVRQYVGARAKEGVRYPFSDVEYFKSKDYYDRKRRESERVRNFYDVAFCGDVKGVSGEPRKVLEGMHGVDWDSEMHNELCKRSVILGCALDELGYKQEDVEDEGAFINKLGDKLRESGVEVSVSDPTDDIYSYLSGERKSRRVAEDRAVDFSYKMRLAALRGEDVSVVKREARGVLGDAGYKEAKGGFDWAVSGGKIDREAVLPCVSVVRDALNRIAEDNDEFLTTSVFRRSDNYKVISKAGEAIGRLSDSQQEALFKMIEDEHPNESNYFVNAWKALNRGLNGIQEGVGDLAQKSVVVQNQVIEGVADFVGADGVASEARAIWKANKDDFRNTGVLSDFLLKRQRPYTKSSYGWFGNGVLGAAESIPVSVLMFGSGVGGGIAKAASTIGKVAVTSSYAGRNVKQASIDSPDGDDAFQLAAGVAGGVAEMKLDNLSMQIFKGVMGLKQGSVIASKLIDGLNLERQAMRFNSGFVRGAVRSGVGAGVVTAGEFGTEKLQDLPNPFFQSLAAVMGDYNSGVDWDQFWKDYTDKDQNLELFGAVLAFGLIGGAGRAVNEVHINRIISGQDKVLHEFFDVPKDVLSDLRAIPDERMRNAKLTEELSNALVGNYGKERDGVLIEASNIGSLMGKARLAGISPIQLRGAMDIYARNNNVGLDSVRVVSAKDAQEATQFIESPMGVANKVVPNESSSGVSDGKGGKSSVFIGVKPKEGDVTGPGIAETATVSNGKDESKTEVDIQTDDDLTRAFYPTATGGMSEEDLGESASNYAKEAKVVWVQEMNATLESFGMNPVVVSSNDFTGEDQYIVTLEEGGSEIFDDINEAFDRVAVEMDTIESVEAEKTKWDVMRFKDDGYVGDVTDQASGEMMEYLDDVGMMTEGQEFDSSQRKKRMTVEGFARMKGEFSRSLGERLKIEANLVGFEMGLKGNHARVFGLNFTREVKEGIFRSTQQLFAGASALDVFEERVEGLTDWLMRDGEYTADQFESALKELELATGDRYLTKGVDRFMSIKEGVSRAARANMIGQIKDERLPEMLRRWFRRFVLFFGKSLKIKDEIERAKKIMEPEVRAKVDAKFMGILQDFAGLDEEARAGRAMREEQKQILAESMDGIPEIGEWAMGKLPRPNEARESGDDLTGELQRIYDAKTRLVRRRSKKGVSFEQKNVLGAEQYFNKDSRGVASVFEQALEEGFEFENSGEMLSAIYDSLVNGRKTFASKGMSEHSLYSAVSFSLSALHASPHSFRKFSLEKMGSGEGNQAYGWGLYFAENQNVNEQYTKKLNGSNYKVELNVENSQLLYWDYLDDSTINLLRESPIEEVKYAAQEEHETGKELYADLVDRFWDGGDDTKMDARKMASEALLQSGIKGIKYEDGLSRNSIIGKTYNYVIFDESDIKITDVFDASTDGKWEKYNDITASFSIGGDLITLESETVAWAKQLSEYFIENKRDNRDMRVCTTPAVLRMVGAKPHDIVITPSVINKVSIGKHMVSRKSLEQIPFAISDPICIAQSDTPGSIEIITDLQENGHNILVAVKLDSGATASDKIKVNRITSLYGKENIGKFLTHPMLYWNKAKARPWTTNQGLQLPATKQNKSDFKKKLLKPVDLVKWKEKNGIAFSIGEFNGGSVWDYLADAVQKGPIEKTRVLEAMKSRLEATLVANGVAPDGTYIDHWEAGNVSLDKAMSVTREMDRTRSVLAVVDSITQGLPKEAMGGMRQNTIVGLRNRALEAKSKRGRMMAINLLVKYTNAVLDRELAKKKMVQLERVIGWAGDKTVYGGAKRGNTTPETYRVFEQIKDAMSLDAESLEAEILLTDDELDKFDGGSEAVVDELRQKAAILQVFGGLYQRNNHGGLEASAMEVDAALNLAIEFYTKGRAIRNDQEFARRERVERLKEMAGGALGMSERVHTDQRTGAAKDGSSLGNSFLSLEDLLIGTFKDGEFTQEIYLPLRKARLAYNDAKMDREHRFYQEVGRILGIVKEGDGVARKVDNQVRLTVRRKVDKAIKELSKPREWGIDVKGPGEYVKQGVALDEARAIRDGRVEKPEWFSNEGAEEVFNEVLKKREKWLEGRGAENKVGTENIVVEYYKEGQVGRGITTLCDMEAAYILQLSGMTSYQDNLFLEGYDEGVLAELTEKINPVAKQISAYIMSEYAKEYEMMNPLYREFFGVDMPRVENYAPGMFQSSRQNDDAKSPDEREATGGGKVSIGAVKKRVNHKNRPEIVSATTVYWHHSDQIDHWINFAKPLRDFRAVMTDKDLKEKITAKFGSERTSALMKFVDVMEADGNKNVDELKALRDVSNRILGARALGSLAYNLKSCVRQFPAMFASVCEMSPKDAAAGVAILLNPGIIKHVWSSQVIQQRILLGMSPEMRTALTAARMNPGLLMDALQFGMIPISLTDAAFTTVSGSIAYVAEMKRCKRAGGMTQEELEANAMAVLDRVVRRTAQPIEVEQKSIMEINAQSIVRHLLMFKSDPRKQAGLTIRAFAQYKNKEIGGGVFAWRVFNSWVMYGVFNQVMADVIVWAVGNGGFDDDESDWWEDYLVSGLLGASSAYFVLEEIIRAVYGRIRGIKTFEGETAPAGIGKAINSISKFSAEDMDWEDMNKVINRVGRSVNNTGIASVAGGAVGANIGALVQAVARVGMDTTNMYEEWADYWNDDVKRDKEQMKIVKEVKKEDKAKDEVSKERVKQAREVIKGMESRAERIEYYKANKFTRLEAQSVEKKVAEEGISESVRSLSRLNGKSRIEALKRIRETMGDESYQALIEELKGVGGR